MESVKRGPELVGEARDWFAREIVGLAEDFGQTSVRIAIETCLRDSPFRPDISEVRKALGITSAQKAKAEQDAALVRASEAWTEAMQYLKRYAKRNEHSRWALEAQWRIVWENGAMVFVSDEHGGRKVKYERLPMEPMDDRSAWCLEQIGGIARVMECPAEYIEIVRKEFLKMWPLYAEPQRPQLSDGTQEFVDVTALLSESSKETAGVRA